MNLRLLAPQNGAHRLATNRDFHPTQPNPIHSYSSEAEKGQTKQDENAVLRLQIQNWDNTKNILRLFLQDNGKV